MDPSDKPTSKNTAPPLADLTTDKPAATPATEQIVDTTVDRVSPSAVNTPGTIILQWLTYAFWGWTVLVSSILVTASISNIILGYETGEFTTYALAAVLVLLPISVLCDLFYSKKEPQKKTGAAMVVMVIHAVLFALIGIGTLITAVFAVVQLVISGGQAEWSKVTLYSALVATLLYLATFLRTLNPVQLAWVSKIYKIFMIVAVVVITVVCVVGPISYEYATKNDKLIVNNINSIESSINSYTLKNNKLPGSLNDLTLKGDAKLLVEKNLVKYTPGTQNKLNYSTKSKYNDTSYSFNYTLCVNYAKPDKNSARGGSYDDGGDAVVNSTDSSAETDSIDKYSSYITTYGHPAGEVCYKLKTDNDYNYGSGTVPIVD